MPLLLQNLPTDQDERPTHQEIFLLKHRLLVRKRFFGSQSMIKFSSTKSILVKVIFELFFFKKRKRPTESTTSTTSGQTYIKSGQTSTTSGQTCTTFEQTTTTSGKASTTSGKRVLRVGIQVLRVVRQLLRIIRWCGEFCGISYPVIMSYLIRTPF